MATNQQTTSVQVMAALLRVKADRRLNRPTPPAIQAIADQAPAPPATRSA